VKPTDAAAVIAGDGPGVDPTDGAGAAVGSRSRAGRRILVVDDDASIREVTQVSLEMVGGHHVVTAACGREALVQARHDRPDAILLDVMMPGLDGPATFERLQAEPSTRDIPVILLTAKLQSNDRARLVALGVRAVLSKPFDPMTLPADVAEILGWPEAADGG
jgi:two-component system alkaline phosphatase synthesis response regulator PhoP